jgi:hypothetical protein
MPSCCRLRGQLLRLEKSMIVAPGVFAVIPRMLRKWNL